MGLFLAQPIAQELALAVSPTSPLAHARRLLTLLVPLAYRPAIKVRMPPCLEWSTTCLRPQHEHMAVLARFAESVWCAAGGAAGPALYQSSQPAACSPGAGVGLR